MRTSQQRVDDETLSGIAEANPGWRIELVGGQVVMSPPTGWETGRRNARLAAMLYAFAERHDYVALDSSTGVRLPNGDVLSADGTVIKRTTWDALPKAALAGMPAVVPEVVVELRSATDRLRTLVAKCEEWFGAGVTYVVLLDAHEGRVTTWGTPPDEFPDLTAIVE